jgi:hypothetical protein
VRGAGEAAAFGCVCVFLGGGGGGVARHSWPGHPWGRTPEQTVLSFPPCNRRHAGPTCVPGRMARPSRWSCAWTQPGRTARRARLARPWAARARSARHTPCCRAWSL